MGPLRGTAARGVALVDAEVAAVEMPPTPPGSEGVPSTTGVNRDLCCTERASDANRDHTCAGRTTE